MTTTASATAVGKYVAWRTGNRDTIIRRITKNRWELRAIDSTANIYLTMAAYITTGALGIVSRQELAMKDTRELVKSLEEHELTERGIRVQMPTTFRDALSDLRIHEDDQNLNSVLGRQILRFYRCVKEGEQETLSQMTDKEKEEMYFEIY